MALNCKSLGLSSLIYSASIANVPTDISANFLWKNKRAKIKRDVMNQQCDKGVLRMIDVDVMFKSSRLAWIPRLLKNNKNNWKTVPEHFFRKRSGLHILLRCSYHTKIFSGHTKFIRTLFLTSPSSVKLQRKRKTVPIDSASRRESFKTL